MRTRRQPIGFSAVEPRGEMTALFARIPVRQAAQLDRLSFELKRPKQEILAQLIACQLDSPTASTEPPSPLELEGDEFALGRHSFWSLALPEVLTLQQAAEFLQVDEGVVRRLAEEGELPGRLLEGEWRFSQRALLSWLAQPQPKQRGRRSSAKGRSRRSGQAT